MPDEELDPRQVRRDAIKEEIKMLAQEYCTLTDEIVGNRPGVVMGVVTAYEGTAYDDDGHAMYKTNIITTESTSYTQVLGLLQNGLWMAHDVNYGITKMRSDDA